MSYWYQTTFHFFVFRLESFSKIHRNYVTRNVDQFLTKLLSRPATSPFHLPSQRVKCGDKKQTDIGVKKPWNFPKHSKVKETHHLKILTCAQYFFELFCEKNPTLHVNLRIFDLRRLPVWDFSWNHVTCESWQT